MLRVGLLWLE